MSAVRQHSEMSSAIFTVLAAYLSICLGSQELIITHSPQNVNFLPDAGQVSVSEIPTINSEAMGFSAERDIKWNGLKVNNIFSRPKATVTVSVEGFDDDKHRLSLENKGKYPLNTDDSGVDSQRVIEDIVRHGWDNQPLIVDFSLDHTIDELKNLYPGTFEDIHTSLQKVRELFDNGKAAVSSSNMKGLDASKEQDLLLLGELQALYEIAEALKKNPSFVNDATPDLYHFRLGGLKKLVQYYGPSSPQVSDAISLLNVFLGQLTNDFRELYSDNVIVQVLTLPVNNERHFRVSRSLKQASGDSGESSDVPNPKQLGVAGFYDENYPVIFNIVLWTGVVLILALIGISYGIWNMDPGRDSIIYRMTSQRMKKD